MNDKIERAIEFYRTEGFLPATTLALFYTANQLYHRRCGLWNYNRRGIDIHEQDWDNLILLDACREDDFWEMIEDDQKRASKISRGSATSEFIRANFTNKDLRDTVYIAGNGWYFRLENELNTDIYATYEIGDNSDRRKIERTVECTQEAIEQHPNKRLIIHFIPPHHPFVGSLAQDLLPSYEEQIEGPLFDRIRRREIDISDENLKRVYRENLERVWPAVEKLLDILPGKTVVSSDHGELLGEKVHPLPIKYYGHIPGLYVNELVNIPWYIYKNGGRKEITKDDPLDEPIKAFSSDQRSVDEQLRNLGYKI